jgi:hypothetical protein
MTDISCEHKWLEIPEGTPFSNFVPFKFCRRCDREEWSDGTILPSPYEVAKSLNSLTEAVKEESESNYTPQASGAVWSPPLSEADLARLKLERELRQGLEMDKRRHDVDMFIDKITKPMFVWRMANGMVNSTGDPKWRVGAYKRVDAAVYVIYELISDFADEQGWTEQ